MVGQPEHPRLLPSRARLGAPAFTWKKYQSLVLGRRAGMAGWGTGGMRKEKSRDSISSGRARVFALGWLVCFSLVIKELKLLLGYRWMTDNPNPALYVATRRADAIQIICVPG